MCKHVKRMIRKCLMTWPGRCLLVILLVTHIAFLMGLNPAIMKLRENTSIGPVVIIQEKVKPEGHRWKQKADSRRPIVDIIPKNEDIQKIIDETKKKELHQRDIEEAKKVEEIQNRMVTRKREMAAACHAHGLDVQGDDPLHQVYSWEYFINWEHSFVWCNVFKSASTSWMYVFNVLAGYPKSFLKKTQRIPLTLARDKYPRPSVEKLEKALSFDNVTSLMIARHPLERLVSCYKDKILGAKAGTVHDKLRRRITLKYRPGSQLPKDSRGLPELPRIKKLPKEFIPTYVEFIQYIVDEAAEEKVPDMHWAPVYSFCNPCQVNINTIAKIETLEEDTNFILKKINVAKDQIGFSKKNSAADGKSANEVTNSYLKTLDSGLYQKLVDLYVIDFDILGYKPLTYEEL